ncbi:MAG TPA: hypothetical protein VGM62_12575 [Chthoniobacterales bacterium]|jgi:hypothetical protein
MNEDFSELEAQLKAMRPSRLRERFVTRLERAMSEPAPVAASEKIIRPIQFRTRWLVGLGLAAAAALLLLVRANFETPVSEKRVASTSPEPTVAPVRASEDAIQNTFIPTGRTEVVYHQRDEGLLFAQNSEQPVRRLRSVSKETVEWKNPVTGASLCVSYPREQVQLVPVSGQ